MDVVRISDATMKQPGCSLSFKEKLELSKLLDRLSLPVIELEGSSGGRADALRIKSVASAVKDSVVAVPVELTPQGVETVWNALKEAKRPRLQVCTPVSTVQMEYICHKKPEAVLEMIREVCACCREKTEDVEFIAGDATRADLDYLAAALNAAIEAGCTTVTVCDSAGSMLPHEFGAFIDSLYAAVPALRQVCLGVDCSDALSLAQGCAIAAVRRGAREVKTCSYPFGIVSLPTFSQVLSVKGSDFGVRVGVRTVELKRVMGQISRLFELRKGIPPRHESQESREEEGLTLSQHDDKQAVLQVAAKLGYELNEEDGQAVWETFSRIIRHKEQLGTRELDAIIDTVALQVPATYEIQTYVINTGNSITAMAHLKLLKNGQQMEGIALGDGPIDAAFLAVEQVSGCHYEMDDFQIRTVTAGHGSIGEAEVRLKASGKLYTGRGISTDIVGASIRAYLNALNKIAYEEGEK